MKISWVSLLALFIFGCWVDGFNFRKTNIRRYQAQSANVAGSVSVEGSPATPLSVGSVSIEVSPTPPLGDGSVSADTVSVPPSNDGSVPIQGPSVPASRGGSVSIKGPLIPISDDGSFSLKGRSIPGSSVSIEISPTPPLGDGSVSADTVSVPPSNDGSVPVQGPSVPASRGGSVSIKGPLIPISDDGSFSLKGRSIPGSSVSGGGVPVPPSSNGSIFIENPSTPSLSNSSHVSGEGLPLPPSGNGSVPMEGSSAPSSDNGSVSISDSSSLESNDGQVSLHGSSLPTSMINEFLFDEFNESVALDSFTGLPMSKGFQSLVLDLEDDYAGTGVLPSRSIMVGLTLFQRAAEKGALCLDGSLPAYHYDRGTGSGENSWLVNLEGGGWCNSIKACAFRSNSSHGSSHHMEKAIPFTGILSSKAEDNPDFYNWNRVRIRYCDGASFKGESENLEPHLFFRGQRIFSAAMEELMSLGMSNAKQALLCGCSAGGLSTMHHCDEFRALFPKETLVKCLSDGGFFLDATDVSGGQTLRNIYNGVVTLQGVAKNLPPTCTSSMDPSMCFFPQYFVDDIKTPLFLVNTAYDAWQVQDSLAPKSADHHRYWKNCTLNIEHCNTTQMEFLQNFRDQTINQLKAFSMVDNNGLFINSCFAHCQTDKQSMWHGANAPRIGERTIAEAVGDWYYGRQVKEVDCPYPCDKTCHNLVFGRTISL